MKEKSRGLCFQSILLLKRSNRLNSVFLFNAGFYLPTGNTFTRFILELLVATLLITSQANSCSRFCCRYFACSHLRLECVRHTVLLLYSFLFLQCTSQGNLYRNISFAERTWGFQKQPPEVFYKKGCS